MEKTQERKIQLWDGGRSFFSSIIPLLSDSLAMVLLIELYNVGLFEKTLMGSLSGCGLLLSLPLFKFASHWNQPASKFLSLLLLTSAVFLGLSLVIEHPWWFITTITLAIIIPIMGMPFLAEVYSNYSKTKRGKRFVTSLLAANIGGILFTYLGTYLYSDLNSVTLLILSFTLCLLISSFCAYKTPVVFKERKAPKFKDFLKVLTHDKLFAYICVAWFLLGSGNLWLLPYRSNFLMEPQFGHDLDVKVALPLLFIIPEVIRMISAPIYAMAFDRFNFVVLRMVINTFFILYLFIFFSSTTYQGIVIGVFFQGLAMGGGSLAWQLWVTRLAPKDQSSTYMAIHTFLTGIRRILCPIFGMWALEFIGASACAWISAGVILFSTLMLIPVISHGKTRFEN